MTGAKSKAGTGRPNGRPREVVRVALVAWADGWLACGAAGGKSVRELADVVPGMSGKSGADVRMVRCAVVNMLRAGELVCVGHLPRPAGRSTGRPAGIYAPAPEAPPAAASSAMALASVLTGWGSARPAPTDAAPDGPQPPDELAP